MVDRLHEGDRDALRALLADEPVWRHLGGARPAGRLEEWLAGALLPDGRAVVRAVRLGRDDAAVGTLSLHPHHDGRDVEVSYMLASRIWGRGLATEAVGAFLHYAEAERGLARIVAETQAANGASRRLLDRLGFEEERRLVRFGAEQVLYARTGSRS